MNTDNIKLQISDFRLQKKLNIYFTAGIPTLEDTAEIMKTLDSVHQTAPQIERHV